MYSFEELSVLIETDIKELQFPARPADLYDPVKYTMESGGKRVRPAALLMACNIFKDDIAAARRAAMAVEMFHNFTLLHDDIMDNASTRRGRDTVHIKWNPNVAILSGDLMVIYAYKLLAECGPELLPALIDVFNRFAADVCEGQQRDMDFESRNDVSVAEYIVMIEGKTAALLGGALKLGAICGGATEEQADILYRFGIQLGIAFQLRDDLLDTYADAEVFGKVVGGDIVEGKKTFLLTTAMERASEPQREKLIGILENKSVPADLKIAGVKEIYDELDVREITELSIEGYSDGAIDMLGKLGVDPARVEPLKKLARSLLHREK